MTQNIELPDKARSLIANVAGQSPLVGQWVEGFLAGQEQDAASVQLVIDAAHVEIEEREA